MVEEYGHEALIARITGVMESLLTRPAAKDSITQCLSLARRCLVLTKQNPDASIALMASEDPLHSPFPLAVKSVLLLSVISYRNQFNDHFARHLLAALLAAITLEKAAQSGNHSDNATTEFLASLRRQKLGLWLQVMSIRKALASSQNVRFLTSHKLNLNQKTLLAVVYLAERSPELSYWRLMTRVVQHATEELLSRLESWVDYPGMYLTGSRARYQGQEWLVVAKHTGQQVLLATLSDAPEFQVLTENHLSATKSGDVKPFSLWHSLAQHPGANQTPKSPHWPFAPSFPVNHPPPSLLRIIDMLHSERTDINTLTKEVAKEPVFSRFLTAAASQDNRLGLPVKNVKQAILTYGLDRVGDMLIQQALTHRLNQRYFPLQGLCFQLATLCASITSTLASRVNTRLTAQSAALISTFMTAPLFTLSGLKILSRLSVGKSRYFTVDSILPAAGLPPLTSLACELAGSWHQQNDYRLLIRESARLPLDCKEKFQREVALLGISLVWARTWLFGPPESCQLTQEFVKQAIALLHIDESYEASIQAQHAHLIWLPLIR